MSGERPGLQAERTQLSWERTASGLLVVGVLVLYREAGPITPGRVVVAGGAAVLALATVWAARRRARRIRAAAPGPVPAARWEVPVLGASVALLAVAAGVLVAA